MALSFSTGLKNAILDGDSLKGTLALGFLKIYAGTVPATANDALSGATLLCTISVNSSGTGLSLGTAASGAIQKAAEVWSGVNAATGTATFYRFVTPSDTGASSTTEERIQGTVGLAGADLNLTSVSLTSGLTQEIDYFAIAVS